MESRRTFLDQTYLSENLRRTAIKDLLENICQHLQKDCGVTVTYKIEKDHRITCHESDEQAHSKTKSEFPDGLTAVISLTALYSSHANLNRLMTLFKELEPDGYVYLGHKAPTLADGCGMLYAIKFPEMQEFGVYLTDAEYERYAEIKKKLDLKRSLVKAFRTAYDEHGIQIIFTEDAFSLHDLTTNTAIELPKVDCFTPRHGFYEYSPEAINAALKPIKSRPRID